QGVDGGKGDLTLLDILAGGLAEGFRRLFDVEYVVDHLECQPDVLAVRGESGELGGSASHVDRAHPDAGAKERASLSAVDAFEQGGVRRLAFSLQIRDL